MPQHAGFSLGAPQPASPGGMEEAGDLDSGGEGESAGGVGTEAV